MPDPTTPDPSGASDPSAAGPVSPDPDATLPTIEDLDFDDTDALRTYLKNQQKAKDDAYDMLVDAQEEIDRLKAAQPGLLRKYGVPLVGAVGLAAGGMWLNGVSTQQDALNARMPSGTAALISTETLATGDVRDALGRGMFGLSDSDPVTPDTIMARLAASDNWGKELNRHTRAVWGLDAGVAPVDTATLQTSPVLAGTLTRADVGYTGSDTSADALLTHLAQSQPFVDARAASRPAAVDTSGFVQQSDLDTTLRGYVRSDQLNGLVAQYLRTQGQSELGEYMRHLLAPGTSTEDFPRDALAGHARAQAASYLRRALDLGPGADVTSASLAGALRTHLLGSEDGTTANSVYARLKALEEGFDRVSRTQAPSDRPSDSRRREGPSRDPLNWGAR
ncbi:hypothetical protein GF342_05625 [Candidatus Woesearchaeota archaeon]|nr:hypothetical protein [Candidatus Woesearchaeota archaeon]